MRHAIATLVFLVVATAPQDAVAQAPRQFNPAPWKDCGSQRCTAGEALRFLLWSRQSDNNQCKLLLDASGNAAVRGACDALVPALGDRPVDELGVVNALIRLLNTQTNTFPLPWASSTAAFSFVIDRDSGAPIVTTRSLGPLFSERALTSGRNTWAVNVSFQRSTWGKIDGTPLSHITSEQFRRPDDPDCTPVTCLSLRWTANLQYSTTHLVTGLAYGLTDNLEVGVSVPVVAAEVRGTAYRSGGFTSAAPDGRVEGEVVSARGRSVGIGDVRLLGKYAFAQNRTGRVPLRFAWTGEVRLPTGDSDALTGLGRTVAKTSVIGTLAPNSFSPSLIRRLSLNMAIGYLWGGKGIRISNEGPLSERVGGASSVGNSQYTADFLVEPSNEIDYTAGLDLPLSNRATLSAEYLGRVLISGASFGNVRFSSGQTFSQPFMFEHSSVLLQLAAIGGKVQIGGRWVASAHVLMSLSSRGVTAGLTPVVGIERVSTRPARAGK